MCGRFTMTRKNENDKSSMLGVPESELGDYTPRFNIAPTQPYFVLKTKYENREAIPATWGFVNSWAKDASRASMHQRESGDHGQASVDCHASKSPAKRTRLFSTRLA